MDKNDAKETKMTETPTVEESTVLLQIQNSKKPDQTILLVYNKEKEVFETRGLKELFGVKEISIESGEVLSSLEQYAMVLSFLLESISTAQDLGLPFGYQDQFDFEGAKYTLYQDGDYRRLQRVA